MGSFLCIRHQAQGCPDLLDTRQVPVLPLITHLNHGSSIQSLAEGRYNHCLRSSAKDSLASRAHFIPNRPLSTAPIWLVVYRPARVARTTPHWASRCSTPFRRLWTRRRRTLL